jgi:hypothetical protein
VYYAAPDLVVYCGVPTWGSMLRETLALVGSFGIPAASCVGRATMRSAPCSRAGASGWPRCTPEDLAFVKSFEETVSVDVLGLGPSSFCHGSPRSDVECVTERTPAERVREFMAGLEERVVVTAHVHVQYDRTVDGARLLSPGSVGLPYEGSPAAYWALLGADVELRRTEYDVEAAVAQMRATDDPAWSRSSSSCSNLLRATR